MYANVTLLLIFGRECFACLHQPVTLIVHPLVEIYPVYLKAVQNPSSTNTPFPTNLQLTNNNWRVQLPPPPPSNPRTPPSPRLRSLPLSLPLLCHACAVRVAAEVQFRPLFFQFLFYRIIAVSLVFVAAPMLGFNQLKPVTTQGGLFSRVWVPNFQDDAEHRLEEARLARAHFLRCPQGRVGGIVCSEAIL